MESIKHPVILLKWVIIPMRYHQYQTWESIISPTQTIFGFTDYQIVSKLISQIYHIFHFGV